MLFRIGIALVLLVVGVLGVAATKPDTFHVQRTATVSAPPAKVFAEISDFHRWAAWSPYEKDPQMKKTFSGAPSGKGAVYEWDGNQEVGKGRSEIVEASPPGTLVLQLDFVEPFASRCEARFLMVPLGDGTEVTWSLDGPSSFIAKVLGLFINMDQMVGGDFEVGLAKLKAVAEG